MLACRIHVYLASYRALNGTLRRGYRIIAYAAKSDNKLCTQLAAHSRCRCRYQIHMLPGDHHISILSLRNLMNLSHCFPDPRQCLPILMSLPCRVTHHTPRALRAKAACSNFPRRPRCRKLRKYVPNRVRQGIGQA